MDDDNEEKGCPQEGDIDDMIFAGEVWQASTR